MKKRFLIGMPALLVLSMLWLSSNIFAKTVSVASYGADGSDAESDHLAFQKALDEPVSATDPLVVEVPAGNYYFDRTIFIHSYTTLKLEDGASLIRSQEGMNRNLMPILPIKATQLAATIYPQILPLPATRPEGRSLTAAADLPLPTKGRTW